MNTTHTPLKIVFFKSGPLVDVAGGMEIMLCKTANAMAAKGHDVTVLSDDVREGVPFHRLEPGVRFVNTNGTGKELCHEFQLPRVFEWIHTLSKLYRIVFPKRFFPKLKNYVRDQVCFNRLHAELADIGPDVAVCFSLNSLSAITQSRKGFNFPLVLSHRSGPQRLFFQTKPETRELLKYCAAVHVLLPGYAVHVEKRFPRIPPVVDIPNMVETVPEEKLAKVDGPRKRRTVISLTRLESTIKQPHVLIRAFAKIARSNPDWKLVIYGQTAKFDKNFPRNDYREYLEKLIDGFGVRDQVELNSHTDDPLGALADADIFVLPSKTEGFPVALTEAMSVGLPCVGLQTASGVKELIVDGETGLLAANDATGLERTLQRLMNDPHLRLRLGNRARAYVDRFSPEIVWEQWDRFLRQTCSQYRENHVSNDGTTQG